MPTPADRAMVSRATVSSAVAKAVVAAAIRASRLRCASARGARGLRVALSKAEEPPLMLESTERRNLRLHILAQDGPAMTLSTHTTAPRPGGTGTLAGHTVARIGYGAMQLERLHDDRSAAIALLQRAFDLGIDHVDTAEFYGDGFVNELIR